MKEKKTLAQKRIEKMKVFFKEIKTLKKQEQQKINDDYDDVFRFGAS